jgi:L-seryl-tRNA(Ser) seleniumtransferase
MSEADPRRFVPGVDRLLASEAGRALIGRFGATRATEALRAELDDVRARLGSRPSAGTDSEGADEDPTLALADIVASAASRLLAAERRGLRPVINATGVVLHTNLGRAPIASEAADAMIAAARGYSNLEFDLDAGGRGSRYDHCVDEIRALTGAEDGLVVNNCAAGLLLAMHALAGASVAVVSRGELVEIGGGFRIPEVLASAGTVLREVGTTNRTRADDYRAAMSAGDVSVVLKVHRSNFRVTGFTEEVAVAELAEVAAEGDALLVHDLGSGLLLPAERLGLPPEPRPSDSVDAGADVVIFSGDKLLGGPQAGIVAGRAAVIAAMRSAPMCRALRVDKVTLAGLRATLRLLLDEDRALERIPALAALSESVESVRLRAEALASACPDDLGAEVVDVEGRVGGGTYPDTPVASVAVRLTPHSDVDALARALRLAEPAVVGRVEGGALLLDCRTVSAAEAARIPEVLRSVGESRDPS